MYIAIPAQRTCAAAWLEAVKAVDAAPGHEAHNVVIDVAAPLSQTAEDERVMALVDEFLRGHDKQPLQTVANTIFPEQLYRAYGAPQFIMKFHETILPRIRKNDRWSGYYFERMTAYPGQNGKPMDLLWGIVKRIKDENNRSLTKFELSLFDPNRDIDNSPYGGQCLSFLSFKLTSGAEKKLMLTAMYRNHYYIEKLLGNLLGLSRLMSFVATESGVSVGELTIVSTHATVDAAGGRRGDVSALLASCQQALAQSAAA